PPIEATQHPAFGLAQPRAPEERVEARGVAVGLGENGLESLERHVNPPPPENPAARRSAAPPSCVDRAALALEGRPGPSRAGLGAVAAVRVAAGDVEVAAARLGEVGLG